MIQPSNRRAFVRKMLFTSVGTAMCVSVQAFSKKTNNTNLADCRDSIFSNRIVTVNGIVYSKDGKAPMPNVEIEVKHLSPKSKRYSHAGKLQTNSKGEYKIITDFPNKELGKSARIHFKILGPQAYETELLITKNDAFITDKHWVRNNKLGKKMFPKNINTGNRNTNIKFNFSI